MNTLRIVLIFIGIVFVLAIYFFQTRKTSKRKSFLQVVSSFVKPFKLLFFSRIKKNRSPETNSSKPQQLLANTLSPEQLENMQNIVTGIDARNKSRTHKAISVENVNIRSAAEVDDGQPSQSRSNELLISFTVLPKPGNLFTGEDILVACKAAGLQLGEYNIFHRYAIVNEKVLMTPVCSLVNLFEPGYFDLSNMADFTTKGLSLFMQLPGPVDGRDAFIILMDISDKLSLNLNAIICDETRSVLSTQTISHIREKVENFRFKLKMNKLNN